MRYLMILKFLHFSSFTYNNISELRGGMLDGLIQCWVDVCIHSVLICYSFLRFLKGNSGTGINIISEERVKFSEQNSENLMKIGWKIRKLWHFEVSQIFTKHFSDQSILNMQMSELYDVIASLFAIYFCT